MGRIGYFLKTDNPGADDAELLARDRLAHELMYFSRGNPVVYYGDEQGFAGLGGDQSARQTMFASQVEEYQDGDQIGTDSTGADDNFVTDHPLYTAISELAAVTGAHPALRYGAQQVRYASDGPGLFAFSRIDRGQQREYVVVLNNSTATESATIPTYVKNGLFRRLYGEGPDSLQTNARSRLDVLVPGLSTTVYASASRIPRSQAGAGHHAREADTGRGVPGPDARAGEGARARRSTRSRSSAGSAITGGGARSGSTTPRRTRSSTTPRTACCRERR